MFDLEERLRAEARQEAGAFVPSPDLPQRVVTGIRRRRQRRVALASAAAVLVVGLGAAGVAALSGDTGQVRMAPPANQPTAPPTTVTRRAPVTTAAEATSTTTSTATTAASETTPTTPTTPEPTAPEGQTPGLDPVNHPVTWTGVGPIRAGDTLRTAEGAADVTFSWDSGGFENFGRVCFAAHAAGIDDLTFLVRSPDGTPLADPLDGVIDVVGGNSVPTEDGIGVGDTVEDMQAVYGSPARTEEVPVNPGQLVWIYEAEGRVARLRRRQRRHHRGVGRVRRRQRHRALRLITGVRARPMAARTGEWQVSNRTPAVSTDNLVSYL